MLRLIESSAATRCASLINGEKAHHPKPNSVTAGNLRVSIVGKMLSKLPINPRSQCVGEGAPSEAGLSRNRQLSHQHQHHELPQILLTFDFAVVAQEKAHHPKPDSVAAGNFRISIVGKLKDGQINQSLLDSYRKQMAAAVEGRGATAERQ